jgi:lipoate-protein ligase A
MSFNSKNAQEATLITTLDACETATQLDREDRLLSSQGKDSYLFLWRARTPNLVVSQQDTRLPNFDNACSQLWESCGYQVLPRRSGGSGFPLTRGMLNISIVKNAPERPSVGQEYRWFCTMLSEALAELGLDVDTHAVDESYCDGAYNLCLHGKKIAGTSQRWAHGPNCSRQLIQCGLLVATHIKRDCEADNRIYTEAGSDENIVNSNAHRTIELPTNTVVNTLQTHLGRALGTQ